MKQHLKMILILALICGAGLAGYDHGFYVGKLDGQANTNALHEAGFVSPQYIDSVQPTIFNN